MRTSAACPPMDHAARTCPLVNGMAACGSGSLGAGLPTNQNKSRPSHMAGKYDDLTHAQRVDLLEKRNRTNREPDPQARLAAVLDRIHDDKINPLDKLLP